MVVSNNAVRHRTPVYRRPAALAVAGAAAALSLLAVPTADAAGPPPTATPAVSAIRTLTSAATAGDPYLPADFGAVTGYRPVLVDGLLVAPHGACSSPVPLPAEFDTACKAHDLGYDVLRYAQSDGHPLGPWARRELDRALADRMRSACTHRAEPLARTRCAAMAEVAAVAVDLNSRRQSYGVPVVEHFPVADTAATWLPRAFALLLAAFATLLTGRAIMAGRFGLPARRALPGRRLLLRTRAYRAAVAPATLRREFA